MNTTADLLRSIEFLVRSFHSVYTIQSLMLLVKQEMKTLFDFNSVWLYDFHENKIESTKLISVAGDHQEFIESEHPTINIKGDKMLEQIYANDHPVYIEDARIHHLTNKGTVAAIGNRTVINCKVNIEGQNVGILGTGSFWHEPIRPLSKDEVSYFGTVSRLVASCLIRINHRQMALIDPLTGINNKRGLAIQAQTIQTLAKREQTKFAAVYIDLDNFKPVNDRFGHACGDDVLASFADILSRTLREADVKARVGGDEFVLILPNVSRVSAIEKVIEEIRLYTRQIKWREFDIKLSFSAGFAIYPQDGLTLEALLDKADSRMYQGKSVAKLLP